MNKSLSLLSLSLLLIALAMPFSLFADDGGRGEGSGGDHSDQQKIVEEGSGSSTLDHKKKSSLKYKDPNTTKNYDTKNKGIDGMDKAHKAEMESMRHGSDHGSESRHESKMREGS